MLRLFAITTIASLLPVLAWAAPGDRLLRRLPPSHLHVADASVPAPARAMEDERDVIVFGGGAVEFRVPLRWQAYDLPIERELRVAVTPGEVRSRKPPREGMWLSCHVLAPLSVVDERHAEADLTELMPSRLRMAAGRQSVRTERQWRRIDGRPALMQSFVKPNDESEGEGGNYRGWRLLVRTRWGVLEIHAQCQSRNYEPMSRDFDGVLASLSLSDPPADTRPVAPAAQGAAEAIGAWKSQKSRLRLRPDGRIEIVFDRRGGYAIDDQGNRHWDSKLVRLRGQFHAQDDVLFVIWSDGSKLNFRWRIYEGELLLTDHTGRISQLRRLLE